MEDRRIFWSVSKENTFYSSVIDTFPQILVLPPPNIYDKSTPMEYGCIKDYCCICAEKNIIARNDVFW